MPAVVVRASLRTEVRFVRFAPSYIRLGANISLDDINDFSCEDERRMNNAQGKRGWILFGIGLFSDGILGAGLSGAAAAIASALAYSNEMVGSEISVRQHHGALILEGVATNETALEAALSIATPIARCPVVNDIRLRC